MSNKYRRGYYLELLAERELEKEGYFVIRSAGSKTPFDLVAISPEKVRLIQIKKNYRPPRKELEEIKKVAVPPSAQKELWIRQNRKWLKEIIS